MHILIKTISAQNHDSSTYTISPVIGCLRVWGKQRASSSQQNPSSEKYDQLVTVINSYSALNIFYTE